MGKEREGNKDICLIYTHKYIHNKIRTTEDAYSFHCCNWSCEYCWYFFHYPLCSPFAHSKHLSELCSVTPEKLVP